MQNGDGKSEYQSIAAQYAAAKSQRDGEAQRESPKSKPKASTKLQEARFTVSHGLLVTFLTLIL